MAGIKSLLFAANIGMMYKDLPLAQRFAAAASSGFKAVELGVPYELPAAELKAAQDAAGLKMNLINVEAGSNGGYAALDGYETQFRASLNKSIEYANVLGTKK